MLIFLERQLAFLATPKTGTTAVETALRPHAEVVFKKNRKHIPAARYANKVAPFLKETFGVRPESVAVIRDPLDQLVSWYRYRHQDRLDGTPQSTKGVSFDEFLRDVISDSPSKRAQVGRQFAFLTSGRGQVAVDHLFAYERQEVFLDFLTERLEVRIEISRQNVSPRVPAQADPDTVRALERARAEDFELHRRVIDMGGAWAPGG